MTPPAATAGNTGTPRSPSLESASWRRIVRDQPLIPLVVLLAVLVALLELAKPGIVSGNWVATTIRAAIPLAILAACQTLAMLTGGIDLSVGAVASMAAFLMATLATGQGPVVAIAVAFVAAAIAGLVNGIGIGMFKVHPLIMTLGMSLVVLGLMSVYQLLMVQSGTLIPDPIKWLGSGISFGSVPNSLVVFAPVAVVIVIGLRRSGFGRLLFAVGDNPIAARLAGTRVWQVLVVLYMLSGILAAIAGLLLAGLNNTATVSLVEQSVLPSVAAAVIGGTSILGGRGGYAGTIVGALILTVLTTLLTVLEMPEAVRQVLFGAIIVAVAAAYTRVTGEA
ncbi:MAG TPA: ABC transporter permease [Candidatus Limnocylindrales bacterium]|nr:ABC transporter permease [Candidatus Limnocylindrales bacterium]